MGNGIWFLCAGAALFAASIYLVNRFDLSRGGIFRPILSGEGKRLPALAALALGIGGGIMIYLGMRS
jgi:hypothetical protein